MYIYLYTTCMSVVHVIKLSCMYVRSTAVCTLVMYVVCSMCTQCTYMYVHTCVHMYVYVMYVTMS